jgi:hypothetical protein
MERSRARGVRLLVAVVVLCVLWSMVLGAEKANAFTAEEWAKKLDAYKADTAEKSKGSFGCPMSEADKIVAARPFYNEAKALYKEFLATGIDKDSDWQLRQAEYDIRIAMENYERSVGRVVEAAVNEVKQSSEWLNGQKGRKEPLMLQRDRLPELRKMVEGVALLLAPEDEKLKSLTASLADLEKTEAEIEKVVLKNRKMKPDAYKGADAAKIKALAKSIVLKDQPGATILKIHIISSTWNAESVVEWTDTTQSAVQHRVTKGLNVQVALKKGADCFLDTLFIHKDTIGGAARGLTGHIMFRDKFLLANVPK